MGTATTDRPTKTENIKVLQVGEFGVRVAEKTWFGVNKPLLPTNFEVGKGYKVAVSTSKGGKNYISQILGVEDVATPATTTAPVTDAVKAAQEALLKAQAEAEAAAKAKAQEAAKTDDRPRRAGYDKPLTDYDLSKDRQIGRAGIIQAAIQSGAAIQWATNLDEYLSNVRKIADFALKYSQE